MLLKSLTLIVFILLLQGCGSDDKTQNRLSCAKDMNETYLRIVHPQVTQSDLEAVQ